MIFVFSRNVLIRIKSVVLHFWLVLFQFCKILFYKTPLVIFSLVVNQISNLSVGDYV